MNPDKIAVLDFRGNSAGKETIGFLVSIPGRLVEGDLARMVVEQRPHDGVCCNLVPAQVSRCPSLLTRKAIVMSVGQFIGHEDRNGIELLLEFCGDLLDLILWYF